MTEENTEVQLDELTALKKRADLMGIAYHHKAGVETLKKLIAQKLGDEPVDDEEEDVKAVQTKPSAVGRAVRPASKAEIANFKRKQANRLVRVEVTNMNPNKREWEGEILTAGNGVVGSLKKYIPFNTPTHVPVIILNMMKERKCQVFYSVTDKFGNKLKKAKLISEFGIKELPPLTKDELRAIASAQLAAGSVA